VLNLCGKTSLRFLPALIKQCRLFITNDSGPMHIAVAVHVPTIAIFGPTVKELGFFPYGSAHRVMEVELACRPCGLHGGKTCPRIHFECMKKITVDAVVKEANEMLELQAQRDRGTKAQSV
jgi:heptosyltransferase-2